MRALATITISLAVILSMALAHASGQTLRWVFSQQNAAAVSSWLPDSSGTPGPTFAVSQVTPEPDGSFSQVTTGLSVGEFGLQAIGASGGHSVRVTMLPTSSPTKTPSWTPSASATPTRTPTTTPSWTMTATPTWTFTATKVPSATPTATPTLPPPVLIRVEVVVDGQTFSGTMSGQLEPQGGPTP